MPILLDKEVPLRNYQSSLSKLVVGQDSFGVLQDKTAALSEFNDQQLCRVGSVTQTKNHNGPSLLIIIFNINH